jgi:hypothetical protein
VANSSLAGEFEPCRPYERRGSGIGVPICHPGGLVSPKTRARERERERERDRRREGGKAGDFNTYHDV